MNIQEFGTKETFLSESPSKEKGCTTCKEKKDKKEKSCSTCKENGKDRLTMSQSLTLVFSIYILLTSIYGTIKLFEMISYYF